MAKKLSEKPLVFIVEDNQAYRMLIGKILEKNGFMVMMFEHGRKAAEMLRYMQPSLILSDIVMPCMDGFEFLQFIRQNFSKLEVPFIYLTSSSSPQNISKAVELGAYSLLNKPISADQLTETLNMALKRVAA